MRRVVITGVGLVSPLAWGSDATWRKMLAGESGISAVSRFPVDSLPVRIAGEVPESEVYDSHPESWERHSIYAVSAAREAVEMAALDLSGLKKERFGVLLGAGDGRTPHGPVELAPVFNDSALDDRIGLDKLEGSAKKYYEYDTMMPAAHVADSFDCHGVNRTCLTACAAGSQAIGEALSAIRVGDASLILAGGSQSLITLEGLVGFTLLNALSSRNDETQRPSRPFDAERDGFVLSEGAGILLLEELEHAKSRGARILAELSGYGSSADAYRVTDPHPQGKGAVECMNRALADARIDCSDVTYINAHGTSTKANDSAEATAIEEVFSRKVPVTSSKSQTGHLIAAAGALELITCVLSIRDSVIPPTINYETPDENCDLDIVAPERRDLSEVRAVLSNSFGFGGQNVSLVVEPYRD